MADNKTAAEKPTFSNNVDTEDTPKHQQINIPHKKIKRLSKISSFQEARLLKRKIEMQLDYLARKNFNLEQEIINMEERLNHSRFTNEIVRQRGIHALKSKNI